MATLYVNSATGDDSRSYATAQNSATPWATIARAAWGSTSYGSPNASAAAQAGDTVLIAAGTYTEYGSTTNDSESKWRVALNPANSGTSGNPITFRGVGNVYIRLQTTIYGPMIGAQNRDYIVWDNFEIDDTYGGSASDFGPVAFAANSNYCQLINSTVQGHNGSYNNGRATFGGNYRLIGLEDAHNITIKNNSISRALSTDGSAGEQNEAGVMGYDCTYITIEHNEFSNCGCAVFVKGAHAPDVQTNWTIRYNRVTTCLHGIRVLTGDDCDIYQNIVHDNTETGLYAGFGEALRSQWVNNTIYNCPRGIVLQDDGLAGGLNAIHFYNNLVVGSGAGGGGAIYNWSAGALADVDASFTRNFYYSNSTHFNGEGIGAINFATWQGTHSKDVDGVNGTDPQFTNAAGGNFHIANATALVTGRVVESVGGTNGATIPVGAYISGTEEIGIESGGGGATVVNLGPAFLL